MALDIYSDLEPNLQFASRALALILVPANSNCFVPTGKIDTTLKKKRKNLKPEQTKTSWKGSQ